MLATEENESSYQVSYQSYVLPALFLVLPPLLLIEHVPSILNDSITSGEMIGLIMGVSLPLVGAYYFIEFSSFEFSLERGVFCWRWRNLLSRKSGEVPLARITGIRREAMEAGDSGGLQYRHRLVVLLDGGETIPLTRGFSSLYSKKLEQVVHQLSDFLGHERSKPW